MKSPSRRLLAALTVATSLAVLGLGSGCTKAQRTKRALGRADKFRVERQLDRAEIEYLNVLRLAPVHPRAVAGLGLVYYDMGATTLSIPYLLKAREIIPDSIDIRIRYGMFLIASGDRKRAAEEITYALQKRPRDPEAPVMLVDTATNPAELRAVAAALRALPTEAADGAPVTTALGIISLREGRAAEGEQLLRKAIAIDPKYDLAHVPLIALEAARGNKLAAEGHARQVAELCPPLSPRRVQYAQFLQQSGNLTGARTELEQILAKTPGLLGAKVMLSNVLALEKKYDEALKPVTEVLARDTTSPDALLLRARIYQLQGQYESAVKDLDRLLVAFPGHVQAAYQLAMVQLSQGETTRGMAALMRVRALNPDFADASIVLAEMHLRQGNAPEALLIVNDVIRRRPSSVGARLLLAEIYRAQGRQEDARTTLLALEREQPNEAQLPLLRGGLELQLRNRSAAREAFELALAKSRQGLAALEQITSLDLAENRGQVAVDRLRSLISGGRNESELQVLLGRALWATRDLKGAEDALREAIRLSPDNRNAYFLLARLLIENKDTDRALENLRQVVEKNPKDTAAWLLTGILLEQKKDFEAAKASYEKLLLVDPKFVPALNNLAYLYSERFNRLDEAQELADRARSVNPNDPYAADTLGWILYRQGKYAWALGLVKEAADRLPTSGEVHYHLGLVHYTLGEEAAARAALQKAVDLEPDFNGRADALERLAVLAKETGPAAIAGLEKQLADRPDDPVTQARLGAAYLAQGDTAKATRMYEKILAASPQNVRALRGLAGVKLAEKDYAKALEYGRAGRKIDANDPELARVMGLASWANGDLRYGYTLLQEAARRLPEDGVLLAALGDAAFSQGRVTEAVAAWLQAQPKVSGALATAVTEKITMADGRAGAEAIARRTLESDPRSVPAQWALARAAKAPSDAKVHYESSLALYPDFTPAMRELTVLFGEASFDNTKAYEWANRAREAAPADRDLARALGLMAFKRGEFNRAVTLLSEVAPTSQDPRVHFALGKSQSQTKGGSPKASLERALALGLTGADAEEARKLLK